MQFTLETVGVSPILNDFYGALNDTAFLCKGMHSRACPMKIIISWRSSVVMVTAAEPLNSTHNWAIAVYWMCGSGSVVVNALCYKPEGRVFDTR
jgi:hypothetical protein